MDSRSGHIWLDGELVDWQEAKLHVLSHGLHYATTAFEGVRVYKGEPFKLAEHIARLIYSCEQVGIVLPGAQALEQAARAYIAACGHEDAYLRPIAWRGSEELGIVGDAGQSHLAMACWPWHGPHADRATTGIALLAGPWRRPEPESWPLQAKLSGLYAIGSANARHARMRGFDDALVLAPDGRHIAELSGANIFFVRGNTLYTPDTRHALNGITRQTVMALAQAHGIRMEVTDIRLDQVGWFDGAFACGTAYEVLPINRIGEHAYDLSNVNFEELHARIRSGYRALTGQEIPA